MGTTHSSRSGSGTGQRDGPVTLEGEFDGFKAGQPENQGLFAVFS